jgi:hypothetical protein
MVVMVMVVMMVLQIKSNQPAEKAGINTTRRRVVCFAIQQPRASRQEVVRFM